jgi:hypothetical protein
MRTVSLLAILLLCVNRAGLHAADAPRNLALNRAAYASSSANFIDTAHMATDAHASTRWQSRGGGPQWIYVDLGADCTVTRVVLRWESACASRYKIQVSRDPGPSPVTGRVENWTDLFTTAEGRGGVESIPLPPRRARYVRLWCDEPGAARGISLSEFEVYGSGGPRPTPRPLPPPAGDGTWDLCGGWKLQSETFAGGSPASIATCGYDDRAWLPATVPGTVLTSYLNLGAIPDPFYGDQQFQVSDWFCRCNWWYRTEIELPESYRGQRVWLNFDGINHHAEILVNGSPVGNMAGAFLRSRFDVTGQLAVGRRNCIAVRICPMPRTLEPVTKSLDALHIPMGFCRNEPTFAESAGWDWMPTIRDRNIGIWGRVFLSTSRDVTIADTFVITDLPLLPDASRADLTVKATLHNHSQRRQSGLLRGAIGDAAFQQRVTLAAGQTLAVSLDKSTQPALCLRNPKLWWPNGYGPQNLYDFALRFEGEDGRTSDVKTAQIGIRKLSYGRGPWLTILCNGRKIFLKGANWGMDEGMMRCDRRRCDARLRLEQGMNFNLLRSCLGNVVSEDFFELCDRYGLMVWEEFGLNGEVMPDDVATWLENARNRLLVRRNHACVAIWCTANEGFHGGPREPIKSAMPAMVRELDPTRYYLHDSTNTPPSGADGPYSTHDPVYYFHLRPELGSRIVLDECGNLGLSGFAHGFRPELGSPTFPTLEGIRRMMPGERLWPPNSTWATHDWINAGRRNLCGPTETAVAAYGPPTGIADFCRKAQMVNMEVLKAIFESWNDRMFNDCTGVMIWMSNPCWPSLIFNTYDYYLEPTAAYFACKKACEPLHVQWNIDSGEVKVVNAGLEDLHGLTVEARVFNMDGSRYLTRTAALDCPANRARRCFALFPAGKPAPATPAAAPEDLRGLSNVHFIKLQLKDRDGRLLSDNFYWRGKSLWNYQDLAAMRPVAVQGSVSTRPSGQSCTMRVALRNPGPGVALMIRLKLIDTRTGLLVTPVTYSDNYLSLVPGQSQEVTIQFPAESVPDADAALFVEGWNVAAARWR